MIGPTGSGKSTLARALAGVWPARGGDIRLDGAPLDQWPVEQLGAAIGYVPQDVELFAGTVAENIARFDPAADPAAIVRAAERADVHEMILRLPQGYQTELGASGTKLSAGQRSGSPSRARSTATLSSSCSTSPTRTSTERARRPRRDAGRDAPRRCHRRPRLAPALLAAGGHEDPLPARRPPGCFGPRQEVLHGLRPVPSTLASHSIGEQHAS